MTLLPQIILHCVTTYLEREIKRLLLVLMFFISHHLHQSILTSCKSIPVTTSKWRITYKNIKFIKIECNTFDEPLKLKLEVCASVQLCAVTSDLILTAVWMHSVQSTDAKLQKLSVKILQKNRWTWFYVYTKSKMILLVFGKRTMHPCDSIVWDSEYYHCMLTWFFIKHVGVSSRKTDSREVSSQRGSGKAPITVHFIHQMITFNLPSFFFF